MRKLNVLVSVLILLLLSNAAVLAEGIEVRAYVNKNQVSLGQSITLNVEVEGDINVPEPDIQLTNARVQYYGPSTQVSIVNGVRTETVKHIYSLIPTKVGAIKIPAIEITWKGKSYYTEPITITVEEGDGNVEKTLEEQIQDYVFMEVEIPKTQLYVNEQILVSIMLYYHQDVQLQNIHYPELKTNNFIFGDFPRPLEERRIRDGKYFNVITFQTTLQPVSKGKFHLGSITLSADIVIPRNNTRVNSFFDSFFEPNYDLVPLTLTANQIDIEVFNLPLEGRPDNFDGAVGNFDLEVTVSPEEVKPGEPITIRSRVTGKGNFNTVTGPILEKKTNFKYYDSQVVSGQQVSSEDSHRTGEKIFEQVIIPLQKTETLPTISFSYFDPDKGVYQTITKESVPIKILEGDSQTGQVVDYSSDNQNEQVLGEDILYIKGNPGKLVPVGQIISPGYIIVNLALLVIMIVSFILKWWLNRESPLIKKRKEVTLNTHKTLKESEGLIRSGESVEFYNLLYQTMQNYLKEFYQITITGISDYETDFLLQAGMAKETLEKIKEFYQEIDEKRFAGYSGTGEDMEQILQKAREIIKQLSEGEVA